MSCTSVFEMQAELICFALPVNGLMIINVQMFIICLNGGSDRKAKHYDK